MAIFTKRFANADEYEAWLQKAGERISVLAINNSPVQYDSSTIATAGPITISYKTDDASLAPAPSMGARIAQVVIVAAVFFTLFLLLISII